MIDYVLAGVVGFLSGYSITKLVRRERKEKLEFPKVETKVSILPSKNPSVDVKDFNELVGYLRDKYMLENVTLSTYEGFPIASTLEDPEELSALAPELLKSVRTISDIKEVVISGKGENIAVFEVNPEIICTLQAKRDIYHAEIEKIKSEILNFVGVVS